MTEYTCVKRTLRAASVERRGGEESDDDAPLAAPGSKVGTVSGLSDTWRACRAGQFRRRCHTVDERVVLSAPALRPNAPSANMIVTTLRSPPRSLGRRAELEVQVQREIVGRPGGALRHAVDRSSAGTTVGV
jgi:hypothetical protein